MGKALAWWWWMIFSFLWNGVAGAQIVNIESVRGQVDTVRWSGQAALRSSLIQNNNSIITIASRLRV
ncbi:MAG: hypothetical protein AAGJ82_11845, partial [Bacteroidota bacterium]